MALESSALRVVDDDEFADEPLGTKQKFWVENFDDDRLWLFKYAREREGRMLGEDWAEWLVAQLGDQLGTPTARVLPAVCNGRRGIVSRSVIDSGVDARLVHGNSLLAELDSNYDSTLGRNNPRYTVVAVKAVLEEVTAPAEFTGPAAMNAFDVWAGYLTLDAWVAGRDRHHENWGVLSSQRSRSLAPSYDHGNALGFQERSEHLEDLLSDPARIDLSRDELVHLHPPGPTSVWWHRDEKSTIESVPHTNRRKVCDDCRIRTHNAQFPPSGAGRDGLLGAASDNATVQARLYRCGWIP